VAGQFRGRGHVTAALTAISRRGLSLDGIHRIELYVEPWNEGSWRAAERAGYHREGLLRSWQEVGAERRDMYMYSLVPGDLTAGG
jgi:ribosomal-protein-alanine N-acetyltransferase